MFPTQWVSNCNLLITSWTGIQLSHLGRLYLDLWHNEKQWFWENYIHAFFFLFPYENYSCIRDALADIFYWDIRKIFFSKYVIICSLDGDTASCHGDYVNIYLTQLLQKAVCT